MFLVVMVVHGALNKLKQQSETLPTIVPLPQQRKRMNEWACVHPPCGVQLLSEMRSFTSLSSTISFQNYEHNEHKSSLFIQLLNTLVVKKKRLKNL